MNFTGGKFKLLPQILPLIPKDINTFVDLFGGGFNVGINVQAKEIIYNDSLKQVTELLEYFKLTDCDKLLAQIDELIAKYQLSKENQEGFLALRRAYNENPTPIAFYTLICYAFNNQIRFNSKGEYNMPFGKNRSSFNPALREKFIIFVEWLQGRECVFTSHDFRKFNIDTLNDGDYVYCDPPYLNSTATYNEQGGWTEKEEADLLNKLDELHSKGIKFGLSNNLKYDNHLLDAWKDKYNVHYLNMDYSNCSYQKKDRSRDIEVLITNY